MLSHTADGSVRQGSNENLVSVIRKGCQIRVARGARRAADPMRTIEHSATPEWVSVRDGNQVEVQLDHFLINHKALGEPNSDHPRRE